MTDVYDQRDSLVDRRPPPPGLTTARPTGMLYVLYARYKNGDPVFIKAFRFKQQAVALKGLIEKTDPGMSLDIGEVELEG